MAFSATDAAFEGFRLARRRPLTMAALSVLTLISSFATYWIMEASGYARAVNAMSAAGPSADPSQAVALIGPMLTFLSGLAILGCFVSAIQSGAIYRGVLRPREHGFLGLAFGGDELRLAGLALIIVLLAAVVYFVLIIVLSVLFAIVGASMVASGGGGNAGGMVGMIGLALLLVGGVFAWLGTKMSLAGPATFDRGKLVVFGSWGMTRDHFWGLFGCYFLAYFLAVLIGFIMFVVALISASVLTGVPFAKAAGEFFQRQPGAPAELLSPVRVVYTVVASIFGGFVNMVMLAPAAEAYRQICRSGDAQAEAFS